MAERAIPATPDGLLVLDAAARTYAGPSRSGGAWHLIQPARPDHRLVRDGVVRPGSLVCTCEGGTFNGRCWRLDQARAFEDAATAGPRRVHDHGPDEGPGLDCREQLVGECLMPLPVAGQTRTLMPPSTVRRLG